MAESEIIQEAKILQILKELKKHNTLLKMHLLDADYENLTFVTTLSERGKVPHFIINYPKGFKEAAVDIDNWRIRFEFTGKDKIKYVFKTTGGKLIDEKIHVKFPEVIERRQRRNLFRLNAPAGTKLYFNLNSIRHELKVLDLSLGGSLGILVNIKKGIQADLTRLNKKVLRDIELAFPAEVNNLKINIKRSQIKRLDVKPATKTYELALEFNEISKSDEKILTELIYRLQREFLRKRLPLNVSEFL